MCGGRNRVHHTVHAGQQLWMCTGYLLYVNSVLNWAHLRNSCHCDLVITGKRWKQVCFEINTAHTVFLVLNENFWSLIHSVSKFNFQAGSTRPLMQRLGESAYFVLDEDSSKEVAARAHSRAFIVGQNYHHWFISVSIPSREQIYFANPRFQAVLAKLVKKSIYIYIYVHYNTY